MASVNPISDRIRRVHVVKSDELDKLIRNIYRAWSYFGILNDKNPFFGHFDGCLPRKICLVVRMSCER